MSLTFTLTLNLNSRYFDESEKRVHAEKFEKQLSIFSTIAADDRAAVKDLLLMGSVSPANVHEMAEYVIENARVAGFGGELLDLTHELMLIPTAKHLGASHWTALLEASRHIRSLNRITIAGAKGKAATSLTSLTGE